MAPADAPRLVAELERVLDREPLDLARAALVIARIEYPDLDADSTLDGLERLGARAAARVEAAGSGSIRDRVELLNRFLFEEEGFTGNRRRYDDFRNSLLNDVLDRRLGIPISLALVYREVACRAGVEVVGVSFPGHFLLRVPEEAGREGAPPLILDPFDSGRQLDQRDCGTILRQHLGDAARLTRALLSPCTSRQWLARMLNNLKRVYVDMRSFPHARVVTELLFAVEPGVGMELRDRGLLAYQLEDYPAALKDLEQYVRLRPWRKRDAEEHRLLTEQLAVIRERVAQMN